MISSTIIHILLLITILILCIETIRENTKELVVKIKYSKEYTDRQIPKISDEDLKRGDWIDLRAAETIKIEKGKYKLINLGIAMELPKGCEAVVAPRSSTFKNYGVILSNSIGVIDNDYNGDNDYWKFGAIALRTTTIKAGERICQFRIQQNQPNIKFKEVEELGNKDRGGIGSTGRF